MKFKCTIFTWFHCDPEIGLVSQSEQFEMADVKGQDLLRKEQQKEAGNCGVCMVCMVCTVVRFVWFVTSTSLLNCDLAIDVCFVIISEESARTLCDVCVIFIVAKARQGRCKSRPSGEVHRDDRRGREKNWSRRTIWPYARIQFSPCFRMFV